MPPRPTLLTLLDELQQGRIYECTLTDKQWHLDGMANLDNGAIYIDPRPAIIDTLLHELIHRQRPWWSEIAVRRHTATLMNTLSEHDLRHWWRSYRRIKKPHRPVST